MVAQETSLIPKHDVLEHEVISDHRVQHEFQALNSLLEYIAEAPVKEAPEMPDPSLRIDDPEAFRWLITVEGTVNLERTMRFRKSLLAEEEVVDAQVIGLDNGQIRIRVITTGGLPMGPLEDAVGKLTAQSEPVDF